MKQQSTESLTQVEMREACGLLITIFVACLVPMDAWWLLCCIQCNFHSWVKMISLFFAAARKHHGGLSYLNLFIAPAFHNYHHPKSLLTWIQTTRTHPLTLSWSGLLFGWSFCYHWWKWGERLLLILRSPSLMLRCGNQLLPIFHLGKSLPILAIMTRWPKSIKPLQWPSFCKFVVSNT